MAATLSYTGTWTGLATNIAAIEDTVAGAQQTVLNISPLDLVNIPDEINQMILLAAQGWGANLGTNVRLGHWATASLLAIFFTNYVQSGVPRPLGGE